ncbi:MAG: hypothetical protein Q8O67_17075 [Deltaproteobacteria bacterium]|nr:hypothetical protein [Deltaproteobacteria bacterium]
MNHDLAQDPARHDDMTDEPDIVDPSDVHAMGEDSEDSAALHEADGGAQPAMRPRNKPKIEWVRIEILKTGLEGVRPLLEAHVKKLGEAQRGRRVMIPLIVDQEFEVADGRHTLAFLLREQATDPKSFATMCPRGMVPVIVRPYRASQAPDRFLLDSARGATLGLRLKPAEVESVVVRLAQLLGAPRLGRPAYGEEGVLKRIAGAVGRNPKTIGRILERAKQRAAGQDKQRDKTMTGLRSAKRALGGLSVVLGGAVADEIARVVAAIDEQLAR